MFQGLCGCFGAPPQDSYVVNGPAEASGKHADAFYMPPLTSDEPREETALPIQNIAPVPSNFESSPFQAAAAAAAPITDRGGIYRPTPGLPAVLTESNNSSVNSYLVNGGEAAAVMQHFGGRPEELLMLQPMENMGLLARPASLHLHELNREITNLQKIGQGAGGIVYRGLWTGVNVAIKFVKSSSPENLNLTAKEAILSRFVSHPNVVQTFTYDVTLLVESANGVQAANPGALTGIKEEASAGHDDLVLEVDLADGAELALEGAGAAPRDTYVPTKSLAIFDLGSRSIQASAVSQMDTADSVGPVAPGWDMQDVLLRLGAVPGEYLTHIIMELCDEGTLLQAISRKCFSGSRESSEARGKLRSLLKTAREVAAGMQHLHSLGIIHGDLKPGNVLLRKEGSSKNGFTAKVGDFGLAQRCGPGAPVVAPGGVPLGTLCYAAPEALRGVLHKSSDVYSFGVMLWQMCTSLQPFHGMHPAHILYGKQTSDLQLQWPPEVYSPIRKLGELCTGHAQATRPNFDQVCKALVQIELRMHRTKAPAGGSAAAAALGSVAAAQGRQSEYMLMPDPDLLI